MQDKHDTKRCKDCGNYFVYSSYLQRFCDKCRIKRRYDSRIRSLVRNAVFCAKCGKPISAYHKLTRRGHTTGLCRQCWDNSRNTDNEYGGIRVGHGYRANLYSGHPHADKKGYVLQHILIWEDYHNQPLPEGYVVHHINNVKDDNRPENLLALPFHKHNSWMFIQALQQRIRDLEEEVDGR